MKKSKNWLITYIVLEAMIVIGTLIEKNYVASLGWGFLMLTNIGLLKEAMETKIDFYSILFSEKVIENGAWKPEKHKWISEEEYEKNISEYNKSENEVIFDGMGVEWDSCDCSDGLCSHGRYPIGIVLDYDKDVTIEYPDENCIEIGKTGIGYINFNNLAELTVGQFIDALKLLKIEIKFKNKD